MTRLLRRRHGGHALALVADADELRELERTNPNLRVVLTMTDDPGWEGEQRRIGAELLGDVLGGRSGSSTFLIAGPPPMVKAVAEALGSAGVPEDQIRPEGFSGY